MGAGHDHSHGHGSGDTRVSRMIIGAAILGTFFVLELVTALMINSIALLADAGHMLTDLVAMFMGLTAVLLARRGSTSAARTYGWHRAEVFTAVANAALLLGVAGFILYEAFERLGDAPEVPGVPLIVVALAGLAANAVVVLLLRVGLRAQPGRQGRLHGGCRRHRRQHRRADRRHRHRHHRLAVRRRRGRRAGRAVGAAPRLRPRPGRAAHPQRVLPRPHRRRRTAHRAAAPCPGSPRCTICTCGRWCPARTWRPRI